MASGLVPSSTPFLGDVPDGTDQSGRDAFSARRRDSGTPGVRQAGLVNSRTGNRCSSGMGAPPLHAAAAGLSGGMAPLAGAGAFQVTTAEPIQKTPLRKCPFCCFKAKRLKVLAGEPSALHENQGMDMPVGRVIIVEGGDKLHGFAQPLFKLQHGVEGEVS